ncbi:hypothetical protein [Aeromonas dhakensis]|uniref:hypothetical protein n=1 Tax=Aeromonas dhakensis TaxID=196024 RepID=UPI0038D1970D
MSIDVSDYDSVYEKLRALGASVPNGLVILPNNLSTANSIEELHQPVETDTVKTLLRINDITYFDVLDGIAQPPYLQQYGNEWFGPTLFITASYLTQNPTVLSITLGLITNYLYDLFKNSNDVTASLDVIYEKADGTSKKVHYKGSHKGLPQIVEIIKELEK